jgi:phenol 2-monooxygenase
MQFHLNGFRVGNPSVFDRVQGAEEPHAAVDVLIVGCGPAGLTLATQLSAFPQIVTRIVDLKGGPLEIGQADGVACRSMEMFEAFGFAERVAKEAYWVNEVAFWRPDEQKHIVRGDRIDDVEDDLSEMPHVILNQARVHDFYLDTMKRSPRRLEPDYSRRLTKLERTGEADYPVVATFECLDAKDEADVETIRARYVVGCDGARSVVREELGHELKGESARQLWGVMDVLCATDFPDIRLKCAIQSFDQGSMLIIPREGGYMVRMYIELDELETGERARDRNVTADGLIDKARAILQPYALDAKEVAWWSAYEIGQRVCDAFDDVPEDERANRSPRIFIAGDACHTHSPKAGQGMNVSMADAFNLGWKLAAVLQGAADPSLLHTYSAERHAKAQELIDFDRDMARLFSEKPKDAGSAEQFQQYFQKHGRYTAGVEARYDQSIITTTGSRQELAAGLVVGMRFHSAPVIRLADAKRMHLGHVLKADGRWRLVAFAAADDHGQDDGDIALLCGGLLHEPTSPVRRYTPAGEDIDAVIDVRAVFQAGHRNLDVGQLPPLLMPTKGRLGLTDYEKAYCPDLAHGPDIFDHRGIDRAQGALVIVRPDQYIAAVLALDDQSSLARFFDGFMIPKSHAATT